MKMTSYNEKSFDLEVNLSSNILEQEGCAMKNRRYTTKETYCDPCNREGMHHKTAGYCVDCGEQLCFSCFNLHKKFKLLQHHVLLDETSMMQSKISGKVKDKCVDKCPSHMDRVIEYICQPCDKLCCSVCIIKSHRKCDSVDFIPDIAENADKSKVFLDINKAIEDQSVLLAEHGKNCKVNQYKSRKLRDSAKEDVRMECQEVHTWLIEKEKEMMRNIETKYAKEQQTFSDFSAEVTILKNDLERVKSSLTTKVKTSQKCQLFVALQNAKLTTSEIQRMLQELEKVKIIRNYQFKEAAYIHDIRIQRELGTFENILSETEINIKFLYAIDTIGGYPGTMCLMSEKMLHLSQRSLTILSLCKHTIIYQFKLNSSPADITKISQTEVAVSFPHDGVIKFYEITPTGNIVKKKMIHVGNGCHGIQYFRKNFIVSYCHNESGSVKLFDMYGQLKQDITGSSELVFQIPVSLALNPKNGILYVADSSDSTVTSLTLDGIVIDKFESEERGLYAVNSAGENGCVYACYACSRKIIQLSENCSLIKDFNLETKTYLDVVFSEKNDFMYASTFEGEINVFEIINEKLL